MSIAEVEWQMARQGSPRSGGKRYSRGMHLSNSKKCKEKSGIEGELRNLCVLVGGGGDGSRYCRERVGMGVTFSGSGVGEAGVWLAGRLGDASFDGKRSWEKEFWRGRRFSIYRRIYLQGFWAGRWVALGGYLMKR